MSRTSFTAAAPPPVYKYMLHQPPKWRLQQLPAVSGRRGCNRHNLLMTSNLRLIGSAVPPCKSKGGPRYRPIIKAQSINGSNCHTYTFKTTTDIPLYEAPEASFDQYLEEKSRVIKAICPNEKRKPEKISEEEWRIYMAPVEFMFLSASPVVHMRLRCKTKGVGYPSGIPTNTSKLLELKVIKSELLGDIGGLMKQTQFTLGVEGVVYPYRKGSRSRIKGHLFMSITFAPPPPMALLPQHVYMDAANLILRSIGERMERNVSDGLLADYGKFKKEKR